MWIFLGIVAFLILLITVILLLPVYVIIKTDENGEMIFRYTFLGKVYGENPDPNNPIIKTLKDASGVTRLQKDKLKGSVKSGGLSDTVGESLSLIISLLKRLLALLKYCKIHTLKIRIVCADGDAAQTAISYGKCYAIVAPIIGFLHSAMRIRKKGEDLSIECDYSRDKGFYEYDIKLMVRVFRVIGALIHTVVDEVKRKTAQGTDKARY